MQYTPFGLVRGLGDKESLRLLLDDDLGVGIDGDAHVLAIVALHVHRQQQQLQFDETNSTKRISTRSNKCTNEDSKKARCGFRIRREVQVTRIIVLLVGGSCAILPPVLTLPLRGMSCRQRNCSAPKSSKESQIPTMT